MYIDTHCHLDDPKLLTDIDEVVADFRKEKVTVAITMGCEVETSKICRDLSDKYPEIYFGAGIHPMDVHKASDSDLDAIIPLLAHEKCLTVGEIGIDLYWDKAFREKQIEYLYKLIDIAYASKLPINVHMRDATLDTLTVLKNSKDKLAYGGVIHCYAGSKETLKEVLNLGLHVSLGGTVTFKNARNLLEIATLVPRDRLLTETDSPFLSPEPVRGRLNTPKNIPHIAKKLAELRGESLEDLTSYVMQNAKALFKKL